MIELELNKVKKNYGFKDVLNEFSLTVQTGEKIALIGNNGAGKSTVLKLIQGNEKYESGTITIRKGAKIGMLNQIYELEDKDLTVSEFLNQGFNELNELESKINCLEKEMSLNSNLDDLNKIMNTYGRLQEKYILMGGYEIREKLSKICTKFLKIW